MAHLVNVISLPVYCLLFLDHFYSRRDLAKYNFCSVMSKYILNFIQFLSVKNVGFNMYTFAHYNYNYSNYLNYLLTK